MAVDSSEVAAKYSSRTKWLGLHWVAEDPCKTQWLETSDTKLPDVSDIHNG